MSSLLEQASLIVTPNAFKAGKLYSIKPTSGAGDLDVVRATTATRVNANGLVEVVANNIPRLDYSNGSCPSILVEPQRTNLVLRSEEFDNAYYTKLNGNITPNVTTAPDGTLTADLFTKTSAINTVSEVQRVAPYTSTGTHTLSVFIKPNVGNSVLLRLDAVNNTANFGFNFSTKTFINGGANAISSSFDELPNGWFRLKVVGNVTSVLWNVSVCNLFANPTNDSFYIWGAQLEVGSNATSYIPTVATTVTRNADVISKTGISDLIGQTEGTLFFDGSVPTRVGGSNIISFNYSSASSVALLKTSAGQVRAQIWAGGSAIITLIGTTFGSERVKIAVVYKSGNSILFINGTQIVINNTSFTFTQALSVLNLPTGQSFFSTPNDVLINKIALFKTALSDAELIQLTTL